MYILRQCYLSHDNLPQILMPWAGLRTTDETRGVFDVSLHVLCLRRVRTQRPLALHSQRDSVVHELGRNELIRRDVFLHPFHERQQGVVEGILEAGNGIHAAAKNGALVCAREVPGMEERVSFCFISVVAALGGKKGAKKAERGKERGTALPGCVIHASGAMFHTGNHEQSEPRVEFDALRS
jgi:hypothetical protein